MKGRLPYIRTTEQKRELNHAVNLQLAESMREHEADYIALAMWAARLAFGCGKRRLLRYRAVLLQAARELENHYEMENGAMYLARVKLRELGIDVEAAENGNVIFDYGVKR